MKKTVLLLALGLSCITAFAQSKVVLKTDIQDTAPKFMLVNGKPAGMCIEIMRLLESRENFKFRYEFAFTPAKTIEANMESGDSDIHWGWASTPARQKIATFGEELYKVTYLGVVKSDDKVDFKTISDLIKLGDKGIVLGVSGVASSANLKKIAGLKLDQNGKDAPANLVKITEGKGRVFIYQNLAISYELQKPENKGKFKVVNIDFEGNEDFKEAPQYVVYSKKAPADAAQKLNAAIVKSRQEIDEIVKKYSTM